MASELSPEDSLTAACPSKRSHGDTHSGAGVANSPIKRQNKGVVGEKEVEDDMPQQGTANSHDKPFAKEDGDLRGNEGEPLKAKDRRGNAGDQTGSANVDAQGNLEIPGVVEQAVVSAQTRPQISDTNGNSDADDIDVDNGSLLVADATAAGEKERESSDSPCSDGSAPDDSVGHGLDFLRGRGSRKHLKNLRLPSSVTQRQQNDPELREKIHKIETDFWTNRIDEERYNEERFELFTEEEREKACILSRREVQSPAGYRDEMLECWNERNDGLTLDDDLYKFAIPLPLENFDSEDEEERDGGDEEAAKKRLWDKIEAEFEDPEARRAEFERWEKIRKVETQWYHERISRGVYNKRRYALYTAAEREEMGVVWPNDGSVRFYSPAGFKEAVCGSWRTRPSDWQTRMDFHYPFAPSPGDTSDEENLCELCVQEQAVDRVRREELRAKEKVAREEEEAKRLLRLERRAKMRQEKQLPERKTPCAGQDNLPGRKIPCAVCNKKFGSESALIQHTAAKHRG